MKKPLIALIALSLACCINGCGRTGGVAADAGSAAGARNGSTAGAKSGSAVTSGKPAEQDNASTGGSTAKGNATGVVDDVFPAQMPMVDGYEILEVEPYGNDGFTMIYRVDEAYENVVGFYMANLPGADEEGIGDEESYFENLDFDGIHLNGITITDNEEDTMVFITLKVADLARMANDGGDNGGWQEDDGEEDGFAEEDGDSMDDGENETEADYDLLVGTAPEEDYPYETVPLFEGLKLTTVSSSPANKLFVYEGIASPGSFDEAVDFYTNVLGEPEKSQENQIMATTAFTGEKDGWAYDVTVADIHTSGNCVIQITLKK